VNGRSWRPSVFTILLALVAIAGVAQALYTTARGPGVGGDATIYIASARNLLSGQGLGLVEPDGGFRPLPYTPPLFPLLLAGIGLFGPDLVQAARWLNALLFGGTIFLAGYFISRFTRSGALGLVSAALVLCSPILVRVYAWAMSEPVFLFLGFLGLFLSLLYAGAPSRGMLAAAALACGLAFLARYIGAAFLGAAGLVVLAFSGLGWGRRMKDALLFAGIGLAPMGAWLVWDYTQTRTVASRSLASGPGLADRLGAALAPLREVGISWLVPDSWIDAPPYPRVLNTLILAAAAAGLVLLVLVVAWRLRGGGRLKSPAWLQREDVRLALGLGLLILVYLAVTLVVYLTTYPPITLDNRMFVPVHIAVLLLVVTLGGLLFRLEPGRRWVQAGVWVVLLGLAGSYAWRGSRIALYTHGGGLGYMMDSWQESETIQAVRRLPAATPVITNETTAVLFLTGRTAYTVQEIYRAEPASAYAPFGADPSDRAQQVFIESGGALVLFDTITDQLSSIYGETTQERLQAFTRGLDPAWSGTDGTIYYYRENGE